MAAVRNAEAERALGFALRHINASARFAIGADDLLLALNSDVPAPEHAHHVAAFLDEVEVETISDLVRSGAITYPILARGAARHLPPHHETRLWLDERA